MPLRNGKEYLPDYLCRKCTRFYGVEQYNYNCSYCVNGQKGLTTQQAFTEKCNQWAIENSFKNTDVLFRVLKIASKLKKDKILYSFIKQIKEKQKDSQKKYILADDALLLYEDNPTLLRSHIVGHIVSDWWNIVSKDNKWPPHAACYYGNFNEPPEVGKNIPPRMPHRLMLENLPRT